LWTLHQIYQAAGFVLWHLYVLLPAAACRAYNPSQVEVSCASSTTTPESCKAFKAIRHTLTGWFFMFAGLLQVQRDYEELPPESVPQLRDSLCQLLIKFGKGAPAVRTQVFWLITAVTSASCSACSTQFMGCCFRSYQSLLKVFP